MLREKFEISASGKKVKCVFCVFFTWSEGGDV